MILPLFESNVNYDLGKTRGTGIRRRRRFESNVNYDLGKTRLTTVLNPSMFESNVNYDLGKTLSCLGTTFPCLRAM